MRFFFWRLFSPLSWRREKKAEGEGEDEGEGGGVET